MPPATGIDLVIETEACEVDAVVLGQQPRGAVDDVVAGDGYGVGVDPVGDGDAERPARATRDDGDVVAEPDGLVDGHQRVEAVLAAARRRRGGG